MRTGRIRPRSNYCAASPNAVRLRRCSWSSRRDKSFDRPGACGRTTRQFRWCRWTASRCGTWLAGLPLDMRLSKEVVEGVTERTGGVPLFVEEVTRLLLERGEQGGVQAIPPTLQQSLTARLDRLGSAREVAQIGAVIGRDFSYGLLRDVAGIADPALEAALERLADADILLVLGLPPDSDYRFKHALIQDAAYENLLQEPTPSPAPPCRRDFARPLRR